MPTDSELLKFLMAQMQPTSPHMDGTFVWRLPMPALSRFRARTALQAVQDAYAEVQDIACGKRYHLDGLGE